MKEKDYLVYRLLKKNSKGMAYKGKDFPTTYNLPTECVVYDEESRPVQLRYVIGEPELLRSKQRDDQVRAPGIKFNEGFLTVSKNEKTLIEYLSLVGWNKAVENKQHNQSTLFLLIDEGKVAETKFEKKESVGRATAMFWDTYDKDPEVIKAVALHFGINIDMYEWKSQILAFLDKEPLKFRNLLSNREAMEGVVRFYDIVKASKASIITFSNSRWSWTGGSPIIAVTRGKNPYKVLSDLTFAGAEGAGVWNTIENRLYPERNKKDIEVPKVSKLDLMSYEDLLVKAKENDVITWSKSKFHLNYKDGESMEIANSAKAVLERMETDDNFVESIKKELE